MVKTFRYGYRRKGQKTWHPLTVILFQNSLNSVRKMYNGIPKKSLPHYGIPEDAIFSAKEIKKRSRW